MNGTANNNCPANCMNRLIKWPLLCVLLSLALVGAAMADPFYQNLGDLEYTDPGNPAPAIDGNNYSTPAFDNEGTFRINYNIYSPNVVFYEPQNMLFYTNYGTMTVNTPFSNINGLIFLNNTFGCGYRFDQQTGSGHSMADTFYNPGAIRCDSFVDGNNVFTFGSTEFFILASVGTFNASATNILNPGTVDVGVDSLMQFTGQNVDLSRSTLTVENLQSLFLGSSVGVSSFGAVGTDTNFDWVPSADLTTTTAVSSFPYIVNLTNSTPYFDIQSQNGGSNVIVRAVFVQDTSPNVKVKVYIDPNLNAGSFGFAAGAAHVEWSGGYVDPGTCNIATNYLYLTDDYVLGASTNVVVVGGVPDNFTFLTASAPLLTGALSPAYYNGFTSVAITNPYAYMNAQLVSTTAPTNATVTNPYGALTNLPGRIQITATKELNLSLAQISGQNYLSLTCTNQYDGNDGAQIASPYSDINLGVTNGFLAVTNLLQSALPNWSGSVQAWSTRWITVTNGITNDFRVLIVGSTQSVPVTSPQVQNLNLHATNSLVISDVLNVMGSLKIDAQNLTLTTNECGVGAGSFDGELNLLSTTILWPSALPNVRWLTNNGAIRILNAGNFGSPSPGNYLAFINTGFLSDLGSTIYASYFENSGTITNGVNGSFILQSQTTVLTNGFIVAGANVSVTTGSLVASNVMLQAGRSLTLQVTNLLTDTGPSPTNGNFWSVGGISSIGGMNLPVKPVSGDLLGTTITNIALPTRSVINIWAATNYGVSVAGYANNAAVGHLILDAQGSSSKFTFNGIGTSNALYVDYLELRDYATNRNANGDPTALTNNTGLVIYYAQAVQNGVSVADKLNHKNGDHLRWVSAYNGYFSSTNMIYGGMTNVINTALAQSTLLDSDGDGVANASDPSPLFVPGQMVFTLSPTNVPPLKVQIKWQTIPNATNYILYTTNLASPNWLVLTNFISFTNVPPVGGWPVMTNVTDTVNPIQQKYYRLRVNPNSALYYGP
jgi:hypothetical protein